MDEVIRRKPNDLEQPADDDWRERANAEIVKRGRGIQAEICRKIDIKAPTLSDILSGEIQSSWAIGHISKQLGIAPPQQKLTRDQQEILVLVDRVGSGISKEVLAGLGEIKDDDPDAFEKTMDMLRLVVRKNK